MKMATYFMHIIEKGLAGQAELLAVLTVFILLDYLSEIMVVIVKKKVTRGIGIEGVMKRGAVFIVILLAGLLDAYVIRNGNAITVSIILFYLAYEGKAVLKNLYKLGLPFPEVMKNMLEKMINDGTR